LRSGALAVLGGSIFMALGMVALGTTTYLSSSNQLATSTYLRLWLSTFSVAFLGLLIVVSGYMMSSNGRLKRVVGGVVSVISSFTAAYISFILISSTASISAAFGVQFQSPSAEFQIGFWILLIGSMVALFVAFPVTMYSSVPAIVEREPETETSEIPS
jgi:hypothetical protein